MKNAKTWMGLSMVALVFGCAGPKADTVRDQTLRCAKLVGERRRELEASIDAGRPITDKDLLECQRIHRESLIINQCFAKHRTDGVGFYTCVHEKLNAKGAPLGFTVIPKRECGRLYDRFAVCANELDAETGKSFLGESREEFVDACQKEYDKAETMIRCAEKAGCREFFQCALGIDIVEMRQQAAEAKKALEQEQPKETPAEPSAE